MERYTAAAPDRDDRQRHAGRPREMPRSRHGRLHYQACPSERTGSRVTTVGTEEVVANHNRELRRAATIPLMIWIRKERQTVSRSNFELRDHKPPARHLRAFGHVVGI